MAHDCLTWKSLLFLIDNVSISFMLLIAGTVFQREIKMLMPGCGGLNLEVVETLKDILSYFVCHNHMDSESVHSKDTSLQRLSLYSK